jgi:hemerythrin-like domain-containing protein
MLKELPSGVKSSITRSITTSFELYMERIQWDEKKFSLPQFIQEWQRYINHQASWYEKVDDEVKNSPVFHEELAQKINATIEKIFSDEPTNEQIEEIARLQEELQTDIDYSCKAEARYLIEKLKRQAGKK